MQALRNALIRAAGAQPATFVPVARAYGLIAGRRSRLREHRRGARPRPAKASWFTPFHLTCLTTFGLGCYTINAFLDRSEFLSGFILAATLGYVFIGAIALFDYFDLLFSSEEYRVLGAHPHHAWSIMVAKLVVVSRAILTLSLCFFLPSIVTVWIVSRRWEVAAVWGLCALTGALATGGAAAAFGSAVVARGGRSALLRILPWVQSGYLIVYFGVMMGRRVAFDVLREAIHRSSALLWLLPSAWFTAPAEWLVGGANTGTWVRAGLAVAALAAIVIIGARSSRDGFGERMLLGPSVARAPAATGARRHARIPRPTKHAAERAFSRILLAHTRTDIAFRSQLLMAVLWPMLFLGSQFFAGIGIGRFAHPSPLVLLSVLMPVSMAFWVGHNAFMISSRPGAMATLLASPVDRSRFAYAPIRMMRRWVMTPALVAVAAWYLLSPNSESLIARGWLLVAAAVILDTEILMNRGVMPELPFSSALNKGGRFAWVFLFAFLVTVTVVGSEVAGVAIARRIGGGAPAVTLAALGGVWFAARWWAKRRVARAAAEMEIV